MPISKFRNFVKPPQQVIKESKEGKQISQLQFPSDLAAYGFLINFEEYSLIQQNRSATTQINLKDSIMLPLPREIKQIYSANVREKAIGALSQSLAAAVSEGAQGGGALDFLGGVFEGTITEVGNEFSGEAPDVADYAGGLARPGGTVGRGSASNFATGIKNLFNKAKAPLSAKVGKALLPDSIITAIEAGAGALYNPGQTAVFEGVKLRTHSFNWKLVPRNKQESETIRKIILKIRKSMHPEMSSFGEEGSFFLKYPDIVSCALLIPDPNNTIFYKPGLISNFTASHQDGDSASFFQGSGSPVVTNLQLDFTEMDIITREDFDLIDGTANEEGQ